ncbi:MAG: hypothetical protein O3B95_05025 [Chloroflexi bacterium]|nr:hypothetical protein [Chloroflexota bacterium]
MNQSTSELAQRRDPSIFQSPLVIGIVAISLMTAVIIAFGSSAFPRNTLRGLAQGQIEDIDRFASVIHYGTAEITGSGARERLVSAVDTPSFDALMKRGLFGADAQRLDLYSITGEPLYATNGDAPVLQGSMLEAFADAVNNRPASIHMEPDAAQARLGVKANLLQTYKLIWDQPPGNGLSARALMVAVVTTNVGRDLGVAYRSVWLIAGVFNAGMVFVLLVLHWASGRAQRRLEQANQALAVQNQAVRESRERMVHAADSTKRAIAEELHGTVQSKLFAIWMRLTQFRDSIEFDNPEQGNQLDRIAVELDKIRDDDIRGISHRLHPSIVRVGAAVGLRSLRSFYDPMVSVKLEINEAAALMEPAGTSLIPENLRLGVYRVAELALGNVAKHAHATSCTVSWAYDEIKQNFVLTIVDDGIGFDVSAVHDDGIGMVNIADYADAMNAILEIESRPGNGTRLTLSIPFETPTAGQHVSSQFEQPVLEPGQELLAA